MNNLLFWKHYNLTCVMRKYRIKHKPSGYYVKPCTYGHWDNLTTKENAKIYETERAFSIVVGGLYYKGREVEGLAYQGLSVEEDGTPSIYVKSRDEFVKEYIDPIDYKSVPHFFIARDKSGILYCYTELPEKNEEAGEYSCGVCTSIPIEDCDMFKNITWETGPQILVFGEVIKQEEDVIK